MLDTEVFFSRHLVEGSTSPATHFGRVPELTQEVFSVRFRERNLPPFIFCIFNEPFQAFFCFRSHFRSQFLTANGQFMDVAPGDTVLIVDPTPYDVARVVPSTNSVMIHPAFDSRRRTFFVGLSALWAPPKPVTELVVNTDTIQDCSVCSPVPPLVLSDAVDVSTNTTPPLTFTVGSITDSVEHREFAAPLREADELERLEEQLKERSNQLNRQRERLAHMTTSVDPLLLENEILRRDLRNTQSRLEDIQKTSKISEDKDRALRMLFEILSRFTESSDRLTAEDCCHFFGLIPQAHPQTIRRQYLQLQRLTHAEQHPECSSEVPTLLTTLYSIPSTNRSRTILDCCGMRALRNKKRHHCSPCCPMNDIDNSEY